MNHSIIQSKSKDLELLERKLAQIIALRDALKTPDAPVRNISFGFGVDNGKNISIWTGKYDVHPGLDDELKVAAEAYLLPIVEAARNRINSDIQALKVSIKPILQEAIAEIWADDLARKNSTQ